MSLPYFLFLNKHVQENHQLHVFVLAWAHVEIHFSKKWTWTENNCFSWIWVCAYLTFEFLVNINKRTKTISAFCLAWAYISLFFWSLASTAEKKGFLSSACVLSLFLIFERICSREQSSIACYFWPEHTLKHIFQKTNSSRTIMLFAWAYVTLDFIVDVHWTQVQCLQTPIWNTNHTTFLNCLFKKRGAQKKSKTIGKLLVFWLHFMIKIQINREKLDFQNNRGNMACAH